MTWEELPVKLPRGVATYTYEGHGVGGVEAVLCIVWFPLALTLVKLVIA